MFVSEDRPSRRSTTDFFDNRVTAAQGATLCYGRFLQADPLGYEDGMNMYGYVGADPVNMADPTGTVADPATILVVGSKLAPLILPTVAKIAISIPVIGKLFSFLGGKSKPPKTNNNNKTNQQENARDTAQTSRISCISPTAGPVIFAGGGADAVLGAGGGIGFYRFSIPSIGAKGVVSSGAWLFGAGGGAGVLGGSVNEFGNFIGDGYRIDAGAGEAIFSAQGKLVGGAGVIAKSNGIYGGLTKTKLISSNIPSC